MQITKKSSPKAGPSETPALTGSHSQSTVGCIIGVIEHRSVEHRG